MKKLERTTKITLHGFYGSNKAFDSVNSEALWKVLKKWVAHPSLSA